MAKYTANGGLFKFDTAGRMTTNPGPHLCPYISATFNGGECAEIDVTGSGSDGRKYVKGLPAGRTIEIECFLDDGTSTTNEISTPVLNEMKDECSDLGISWAYAPVCGDPTDAGNIYTFNAKLYDFNIDSDLDGALKVSMTWRLTAD